MDAEGIAIRFGYGLPVPVTGPESLGGADRAAKDWPGVTLPDVAPAVAVYREARRAKNEAGIKTMAVGNIFEPDHANSILMAGRADLVCLARPHLAEDFFRPVGVLQPINDRIGKRAHSGLPAAT